MEIATIPLDQIKPAPYNPRRALRPGDPRYDDLRASIKEFGYLDPIIWNRRTGHAVGGNQRLQVLREEGYQEAQVSVVDLDPIEEKTLALALNKIQGEWEARRLAEVLAELEEAGQADKTGFHGQELEDLLSLLEAAQDQARYDELMEPGVDREQAREEAERSRREGRVITISLTAGDEIFTPARLKEIRARYAPLGVTIAIKGEARE